jgi:hypothetical protein
VNSFNHKEGIRIEESIQIKMRTYFSIQHIQSAAIFCRLCQKAENEYDGKFNQGLHTELRAYVTSTIFACVSFLEASINEIFCDATDSQNRLEVLGEDKIKLLSNMWEMSVPRTAAYSITDKYQITLTLLEKPLFDKGTTPFQDISILIRLRNALTHYEPEWFSSYSGIKAEIDNLNKLSRQLIGKFPASKPFEKTGNPYFPDKCLGYGCAKWAVLSCIKFTDEFYTKIGKEPTYNHVRENLQVELPKA